MTRITPSKIESQAENNILRPLLEDQVLMALLKNRYVPLSFIFKRLNRKPTVDNCMPIVAVLLAFRDGVAGDAEMGVFALKVHFTLIADVLHVGGGRRSDGRGKKEVINIDAATIREVLSPVSRQAAKKFAEKHYDALKEQYDLYERVLKECERSTSLSDARERLSVNDSDWQRLKAWMARFGLVRDVVCAVPILLGGPLVREIEQRYLGQRVEDVVPNLLREQMASAVATNV